MEYFRRALAETGDDDLLRARILQSLSFPASKQEGFPAAREYAREAVELAERLGDKPTLARALAHFGFLEFMCDEGVRAELFERAVALEESSEGSSSTTARAPGTRARSTTPGSTSRRGRCSNSSASGPRERDAAVNMPLYLLANIELEPGNWDRAEELARESYDVAVQTGREAAEPRGLFTLARVEAARGEFESARSTQSRRSS